jgi:hypothetical protein
MSRYRAICRDRSDTILLRSGIPRDERKLPNLPVICISPSCRGLPGGVEGRNTAPSVVQNRSSAYGHDDHAVEPLRVVAERRVGHLPEAAAGAGHALAPGGRDRRTGQATRLLALHPDPALRAARCGPCPDRLVELAQGLVRALLGQGLHQGGSSRGADADVVAPLRLVRRVPAVARPEGVL